MEGEHGGLAPYPLAAKDVFPLLASGGMIREGRGIADSAGISENTFRVRSQIYLA
jgi:hypothetical protein